MVKQVIGETFEQLGKTVGQAVKQAVQEPGKIVEQAGQQVGGATPPSDVEQGQSQPGPVQQAMKKRATSQRLTYLQDELRRIKQQKAQEPPKQVTGKPGFSEQKAIKQLETQKEKKEIEPLVVAQARLKGGTGERKRIGPSG